MCQTCLYTPAYTVLTTSCQVGVTQPSFRVENTAAVFRSHNKVVMDLELTKSLAAIFGVSEMASLHRLYLNFMSTPKEKFNTFPKVSEEASNNLKFKLGGA